MKEIRASGRHSDRRDYQDHARDDQVVRRLDVVGFGYELPGDTDAIPDPAQEVAGLDLIRPPNARIDRRIRRRGDLDRGHGRGRGDRRSRDGGEGRERWSRAAVRDPTRARREQTDEKSRREHDGRKGERKQGAYDEGNPRQR